MNAVGLASIVLGLMVLGARVPLIVAPGAFLRAVAQWTSTDFRVRAIGFVFVGVGAGLVHVGSTESSALAAILVIFGSATVLFSAVLLIGVPGRYRAFLRQLVPVDGHTRLLKWRLLGVAGAVIGVLLIYSGGQAL